MRKPNNYENTQAQGEFTPVEFGGHRLIIKSVEERMSKTNKPMLVVFFDFAQGDKQAGYFTEAFKNDIQPEKKWPNQATQYILTEDDNGNCSRSFKTFVTCIEHSNKGFSCWKADDTLDFTGIKNKLVGGVYGPQMDYYNGRELEKRVLRWFTSIDKVADAAIPDTAETQAYKNHINNYPVNAVPAGDGFMNVPDGLDEMLPFN